MVDSNKMGNSNPSSKPSSNATSLRMQIQRQWYLAEQEGGTDGDSLLISGLCQSRSRFSFAIVMGSCSLDKQQRKTRGEPAAKAFHKIFSYFLQVVFEISPAILLLSRRQSGSENIDSESQL
ncbi:uncharacterized protein LOC143849925 isoform X2 [Tasmannia lanceolata]|uniref:uncharacterized protein LOC143849925 isoform X2 n=1 Tax=Tasmannia lanceolata TaxID=3420 RepID=UPI004064B164